jgi:hypothetical protein
VVVKVLASNRRLLLVMVAALLLAAMVVGGMVSPALAQSLCEWEYQGEGWWAQWCWSPDLGGVWWIADWWREW